MTRLWPALSLPSPQHTRAASVFCLILFAGLGLAAQAEEGCIQGKVLDPSGAPVPSVYVLASTLDGADTEQVQSDGEGYFLLSRVPAGRAYEVFASDKDELSTHSPKAKPTGAVRVRTEEDQCFQITLRQPPRARLQLNITNLLTGEAVKSVKSSFRFHDEWDWRGGKDEQGAFLVPPNSEIEVQIGAIGYEGSEILKIASPPPGKTRKVAVALRPLKLGCITGTVADRQGSPVSGARIQADSTNDPGAGWKITDTRGHFRFDGAQPGDHTIFIYAEGYPIPGSFEDGLMSKVTVASVPECADVVIKLGPKAAKLSVKVIDAVTQTPLEDAEVWAAGNFAHEGGWSLRVSADPMPVPALTQFNVYAHAAGYVNPPSPPTVLPMQPGQTQEITIALQPKP
jgi:hypothetical protein